MNTVCFLVASDRWSNQNNVKCRSRFCDSNTVPSLPIKMQTAIIISSEVQNQYLDLAKTQITEDMLDIKGFVDAINYNIDPLIIDEQWNMLKSYQKTGTIVSSTPRK